MDREIFKNISYGMYFVSSMFDGEMSGCVINTLCQITSNNPIISISLNKNNYTSEVIKKSRKFAVSIISVDTKKEVIGKFGYKSTRDLNKFEDSKHDVILDVPVVLEDICGYIISEVIEIVDCGSHDVILARVIDAKMIANNEAMTYKYYQENLKGVSPRNAPTYVEEVDNISNDASKYRCRLCGFIYDDSKEKVKFEELLDDWRCPLCGASKSMFEKI